MVSNASDDLPLPLKPVKTTSLSRGIESERFLRLCSRAPPIFMNSLLTVVKFQIERICNSTSKQRGCKVGVVAKDLKPHPHPGPLPSRCGSGEGEKFAALRKQHELVEFHDQRRVGVREQKGSVGRGDDVG